MKLIDYIKTLPKENRQVFAIGCGTSLGFLKNLGYGYRPCAPALAVRIEQKTEGCVTRRDMRPDDWREIWPELADSEPKHPAALSHQAQVATETVAVVA